MVDKSVCAQSQSIEFDDFYSEISGKMDSTNRDFFDIFDVDSNHKLSLNEISELIRGYAMSENLSATQTEEKIENILRDFSKYDTNNDSWIEIDEYLLLMKILQAGQIKNQFDKLNINQDRSLSFEEINASVPKHSSEEIDKILNETKAKIDDLNKNPDKIVDNMLKGVGISIAGEEFYQMDKNQDKKATKEEYITYKIETNQPIAYEDKSDDLSIEFTKEDFEMFFDNIKKANNDFITKEEYIDSYNSDISDTLAPTS